jgi:hypothetical protein
MKSVITGQPKYVDKKLNTMRKQGYVVQKSHAHPDGSRTYVLELPTDKTTYGDNTDDVNSMLRTFRKKDAPQTDKHGGSIKKSSKQTKHTW